MKQKDFAVTGSLRREGSNFGGLYTKLSNFLFYFIFWSGLFVSGKMEGKLTEY